MEEMMSLIRSLNIEVTKEEMTHEIGEMNKDNDGGVAFEEFRGWWHQKKYGRPPWPQSTHFFLEEVKQNILASTYLLSHSLSLTHVRAPTTTSKLTYTTTGGLANKQSHV